MLIHEHSRGIPRTISVICDNALVSGFAIGRQPVDREILLEVSRDFHLHGNGQWRERAYGQPGRKGWNRSYDAQAIAPIPPTNRTGRRAAVRRARDAAGAVQAVWRTPAVTHRGALNPHKRTNEPN